MGAPELLAVRDLAVRLPGAGGGVDAVRGLDLAVGPGAATALVGESGCGKTATALSLLDLLPPGAAVAGRIAWEGSEVLGPGVDRRRELRGRRIGMVFQEPAASLDPVVRIGDQLAEVLRHHRRLARAGARRAALALLEEVRLSDAAVRSRAYPHQLSGGMCQRVALALALASAPRLLIADEPTTALDVTVQARILELLRRLRRERGLALLFVTHDLALVPGLAERVTVMLAGRMMEDGPTAAVLSAPAHPYTRELVAALPENWSRAGTEAAAPGTAVPAGAPAAGCPYAGRCPHARARCREEAPATLGLPDGRRVACLPEVVARGEGS